MNYCSYININTLFNICQGKGIIFYNYCVTVQPSAFGQLPELQQRSVMHTKCCKQHFGTAILGVSCIFPEVWTVNRPVQ